MARAVTIHERGSENALFAETSLALADLALDDPRSYSVADLKMHNRRRWRSMADLADGSLVEQMFTDNFDEFGDSRYCTYLVASHFIHAVAGRAATSFELFGRVWDTHPQNFHVRTSTEGGFDWVGVHDTSVRVLPDDQWAAWNPGAQTMVVLPGEREMGYWLAGRIAASLAPAFELLGDIGHCYIDRMWATAGRELAFGSAQVARLGGVSREKADRRVQFLLDGLYAAGYAVRGADPLPNTVRFGRRDRGQNW